MSPEALHIWGKSSHRVEKGYNDFFFPYALPGELAAYFQRQTISKDSGLKER